MLVTPAAITALFTGFRREFEASRARAEPRWDRVATLVPSTTRSNTYGWLGQFPKLREWVGDRVVKDMAAHSYAIENKDWEATVGVDRNDIEDDNLGIYSPLVQEMGYAAATYPDELVFPLLKAGTTTTCYDGQYFFDTDHPVHAEVNGTGAVASVSNYDDNGGAPQTPWYLLDTRRALKPLFFQERKKPDFIQQTDPRTSDAVFMSKTFKFGVDARSNVGFGFWQQAFCSTRPLNSDTLDAAIKAMMEFKADGGRPLGISPDVLIVPPALRSAANKTVKVMLSDGGASNPNYEAVDVEVIEWLA